ncbi:MAG: hypothetical protein P1U34_00515 [Coxiellaceae bacterium]|nr:hypothetical protein [Coxiellaceae bacterium]
MKYYLPPGEAFKVSSGISGLCFIGSGTLTTLVMAMGDAVTGVAMFQDKYSSIVVPSSVACALFAFAVCYTSMVDPDTLAYRGVVSSDFFHLYRSARRWRELLPEPATHAEREANFGMAQLTEEAANVALRGSPTF